MEAVKGNTRRVYLNDLDLAALKQISEVTNLGQTELLTQIVHAGIQSISENGNRVTFPLRFSIGSEPEPIRQTSPPIKPRK